VYSRERANFFLKKLELLPDDFVERNPLVLYMKVATLVNNLELDRAHSIMTLLEKKLLRAGTREAKELLGEVYWMMGCVYMLLGDTAFPEYFKRAYECLPNGSPIKPRQLHVGNVDLFNIEDNKPGAIERMEKAVHEAMPYFAKVANGGGSGMEYLYSAEAGYFTFDFNLAKQNAHKAIYAASEAGQHDILCNAHAVLSRVALMHGDYDEFRGQVDFVRDYINERELGQIYELRDCVLGTMYVVVGDYHKVARWIVAPDSVNQSQSPAMRGRDQIINAEYLLGTQKYYELLALVEYIEGFYKLQGKWVNLLKARVMHAVAHLKIGDQQSAVSVLWDAYEMSHSNNVITPFVEFAGNMRSLIEAARRSGKYSFDSGWLDDIYRKSATHAKRLALISSEYYKRDSFAQAQAKEHKLSRREAEILNNLSQGLTREEIADINSLSINTIKSVIKSTYNKLGAVNRADAVRIATVLGILK
jgi:LuxR family maltose regulon positive regulatory protein